MPHLMYNLDEEYLHAMGANIKIVGSKDRQKHENQNATSRTSITLIRYAKCLNITRTNMTYMCVINDLFRRCGCPAPNPTDCNGPTFFLIKGNQVKPELSQEFLIRSGAEFGSMVVPTENAYLIVKAWADICSKLTDLL